MKDSVFAKMLYCNNWRSYGYVVPLMELTPKRAGLNSTIIYADIS